MLGGGYVIFFSNSGSEANETAFKIARQYHEQKGEDIDIKLFHVIELIMEIRWDHLLQLVKLNGNINMNPLARVFYMYNHLIRIAMLDR